MLNSKREPSIIDYLAGGMLASGILYFWPQVVSIIPALAWLSMLVYIMSGIVSSYFVCSKASRSHLMAGMKNAVVSWIFSMVLLITIIETPSIGFALTLLISLIIGGVMGSYLALKRTLRDLKPNIEPGDI